MPRRLQLLLVQHTYRPISRTYANIPTHRFASSSRFDAARSEEKLRVSM
jgi:hypothetical protein